MSRRVTLRVIATLAAIAASAALMPAGALADPSATPPPNCAGSFDPYAYTRSALAQCGIATYPATTSPMPGGGTRYSYSGPHGIVAEATMPPAGFNPETASPAQLAEYGYPPRPANMSDSNWTTLVSLHRSTPEPFLPDVSDRTFSSTVYYKQWSGYQTTGGGFTSIEADYNEGSFNNSVCGSSDEATWAGIGGGAGASGYLFQTGTAHSNNISSGFGLANHQPWYEIASPTGGSANVFPQAGTTNANDSVSAITDLQSSPGYVAFSVYDFTTGKTWNATVKLNGRAASPSRAEVIIERPTLSTGSVPALSDFGTLNMPSAEAAQNGLAYPLSSFANAPLEMTNDGSSSGTPLSIPGGSAWGTIWQHCS